MAQETRDLNHAADELCARLEKSFRAAYEARGEMPSALQMAELKAHEVEIRTLLDQARAEAAPANNAALDQELKSAQAERDKLKADVLRAKADFLNYQDRASKDYAKAEENTLRGYVNEMLPVLDNLELALRDARSAQANLDRVREALEMIALGLTQTLAVRGLERIDAERKPFDPAFHESSASRPADAAKEEKPNYVAEVCRPGYLWKKKLLRPAQVLITK
jgi:molecular chaperone GrpE